MSKPYLEITYRQGKPFAAYLYLDRRSGDKAHRTERHGELLADFTSDGRVIGVEFPNSGLVDLAQLNSILAHGQHPALSVDDLMPLRAA